MTSVYLSLETSFSTRTPSLTVNSFSLKNQETVGLGFDLIMHSNLASFSLRTFILDGSTMNAGPELTLSLALFETASPSSLVILTEKLFPLSLNLASTNFNIVIFSSLVIIMFSV